MKPTPKNKPPVKARKMWEGPEHGDSKQQWSTISSKCDDRIFCQFTRPVFVIPASREAYDSMLEQQAKTLKRADVCNYDPGMGPAIHYYLKMSQTALAAIGITRPAK